MNITRRQLFGLLGGTAVAPFLPPLPEAAAKEAFEFVAQKWYHIAVAKNNAAMRLFVDGKLVGNPEDYANCPIHVDPDRSRRVAIGLDPGTEFLSIPIDGDHSFCDEDFTIETWICFDEPKAANPSLWMDNLRITEGVGKKEEAFREGIALRLETGEYDAS